MFALVESAFRIIDLGGVILERKRSLPDHHAGLPDRLKKEMRESFHILDTDCDGLVSRAQVENLVYRIDPDMTHGEMADLLDTADLDADGMYDIDEYLFLMYLKWNDQESVDDIKEAFRVFDKDNSGALSRDEFAYILRKLGEPLTDFEVDEILDHFDRDGSGEIDFDEFAYVMTGPHLDEDGTEGASGIHFSSDINSMGPIKRILASPVSRAPSYKQNKAAAAARRSAQMKSRQESEEQSPLAGVVGRRIIQSAPSGKEMIKFDTYSPTSAAPTPPRKSITSAAELRPLQSGSRALTGGQLIIPDRAKSASDRNNNKIAEPHDSGGSTAGTQKPGDVVIERYHDKYGKPTVPDAAGGTHKPHDDITSLDSDNFSMCSDIIRSMHMTHDHYVPEDSDIEVEDHYV